MACVRGNYLLAISYYRNALRISRGNAMLWNKMGVAELQLNEWRESRKCFRRALKLDPRLIPALNNLGAVALLEKKYKQAVGDFKQALALDESVAATHVNLAEAWAGMHKMDRAMSEYARALELDPDVLSRSRSGDFAEISTPEERARISYLIAEAYMKRGNAEGALDYLERAREYHFPDLRRVYSDPDFAPLWKDPRLEKIVRR
ncbi:MAG: tetratricopeptide repeat protein [Terracidiphilus sp.]